MINLFRNIHPANLLILVVFAFFMRISLFLRLPEELGFEFFDIYDRLLINVPPEPWLSPVGNVVIATILLLIQALWFNRIINNHSLLSKQGYLPALMYITAASLFSQFFIISPPLLCNFLLIWMMDKLLKVGKAPNAMMIMFDAGMIIALGTVIYFPFIVLLVIVWLSLLLYRSFNWREWLSGLLGFLTIFFFIGVYYYWYDKVDDFIQLWRPLTNRFPTVFQITNDDYLALIPVAIIMVLASLQLQENFYRSFISTRRAFQMLFFMFILTLISIYTKANFSIYHFLLAVPPGAVLLAYYFSNAKKRWFYESLFIIWVISIQYFLFV